MDNTEFSKKYWSELKVYVGNMISESPLHPNKQNYVVSCWEKLKKEIEKYELDKDDFKHVYSKLRKQIEKGILEK